MAEINSKNLLVMCFDGLGAAYKAVQLAGPDVDVIEIFPLGLHGHVIFCSDNSLSDLFKKIQTALKENLIQANLVENCPAKVLRAYLSVENAEIENHLLVAEATYIGDLMSAASTAVDRGLKIIDLRMLRGASSASYMFLTGAESALQEFALASKLKVNLILNANAKVCDLFRIQPPAGL